MTPSALDRPAPGPVRLLTSPPSRSVGPGKLDSNRCSTIIPSAPTGYTATLETVNKSAVSFTAALYSRNCPKVCFSLVLGNTVMGNDVENQIRFLRPGTPAR